MNAKVVVIVPTFNRLELLKKSVQSVLDQTCKPMKFLILNNNSSDGTKEYLSSLKSPDIKVYHKAENLGASGGMRFLFEKALELKPDWIWVMDDDGIADPKALEELVNSPVAKDPNTYILESTILDQNKEWSPPNRPAIFDQDKFDFKGLPENALEQNQPIAVNTGGYCGLMVRREAFEEFGFPKEEFYLWYDDVEFVLRVSLKKKVFLIPSSKIQHFAQALVPQIKVWPFSGPLPKIPKNLLWRYYYGHRNWLWMAKQWLPQNKYAVFWAKHMLRNLAAPVLLRQDNIVERWGVETRAGLDAIFNRLGKR